VLAAELAARLGAELWPSTAGDVELRQVGGLAEAEPHTLSFLANARYRRHLRGTRAGAVLLRPAERGACPPGVAALIHADPYTAFARAAALLHPQPPPTPGVDPAAYVHESAVVEGARVEAFAWVGPGAVVGPGTWLEAGAVVGPGARVGRDCRLMPHSVVAAGCALGDRVWLNPGAVVGGEGFGFAPGPAGHTKVPQLGGAIVEDDVEVGVHSAIDRATLPDQHTRVGAGARLDNFVQIGHGAEVGPNSLLVAYSGLAGSARIGANVVLAAKAAVMGHLELGEGVRVAAGSLVVRDAPAGATLAGSPAIDHARWLAQVAAAPELADRVRALERRLAELERRLPSPTDP
jgi:UDP-3-O-[3-hydroxymyristoyl] glucosamine N-acyltransferase